MSELSEYKRKLKEANTKDVALEVAKNIIPRGPVHQVSAGALITAGAVTSVVTASAIPATVAVVGTAGALLALNDEGEAVELARRAGRAHGKVARKAWSLLRRIKKAAPPSAETEEAVDSILPTGREAFLKEYSNL